MNLTKAKHSHVSIISFCPSEQIEINLTEIECSITIFLTKSDITELGLFTPGAGTFHFDSVSTLAYNQVNMNSMFK